MTARDRELRVLPTGEGSESGPPGLELGFELDRRELGKLLAASASLAGLGALAGCMEAPSERIMPRVEQPPELVPGIPLEYATAMELDGFATGLVVATREARPIKIEGNPDHPASLGATTAIQQASVLDLYEPHRRVGALEAGAPVSLAEQLRAIARRDRIPGLWFLLHPQSSPLVEALLARVRARHPGARIAFHAPIDRRAVYEGARRAFGRPLEAQYRFDRAGVVVALDADFLGGMPSSVRWSRDFAARRRLRAPGDRMSRLYAAEPRPTPTGTLADHRLPARPGEIAAIAAALAAAVEGRAPTVALPPAQQRWVEAAAADLRGGGGLVVAGDRQPPEVHALAHLANAAIGAPGDTVVYTRPAVIEPLGDGLAALSAALSAGAVQMLVAVGGNPVYEAPADLDLGGLIARVPESIHAAVFRGETSRRCRWFFPLRHYLESWGDARAYDGTITLIQPVIRPMYDSVTLTELLAAFAGDPQPDAHRLVRERYEPATWPAHLRRGLVPDTALPAEAAAIDPAAAERLRLAVAERLRLAGSIFAAELAPGLAAGAVELSFDASPAVHDGRFATNGWLLELPKPIDKLTWGNAAMMSPSTARALGVETHDVVRVTAAGRSAELPAYVLPGHADGCVSLELGYGRWAATPPAEGVGTNVYPLRSAASPAYAAGARIAATGGRRLLAITQRDFGQHDRPIAPAATLARYRAAPAELTAELWGSEPTWLPDRPRTPPQWAMTIDTMICSGCSACVIACQAENNVPVVGAAAVRRGREMHWLRIDTYREERADRADGVEHVHQPMLCQHCEKAPCEYVCPVYATQHSPDGLNEMVYNRCIGTRFCSNNCPYKVRRFNWFELNDATPAVERLHFNPDVTVRARGVMEKCTYCVQRIRRAEIAARKERREIRPGEVVTACQQACPTGAIQFGQLQHAGTPMVAWRGEPRRYAVLHDLGTIPRTAYLAKITNPKAGLPQ